MDPDQTLVASLDEAAILLQPAAGTVRTVAIGDAVGGQHAHTDLSTGLSDGIEAALDGVGRLVVVNDGGRAGLERLERAQHRRPVDHLQIERGMDTVEANLHLGFEADRRDYGIGNQILRDLGLTKLRIMTNNPRKIYGLEGFGLKIVERVPLEVPAHDQNRAYLRAKKDKLGHMLENL